MVSKPSKKTKKPLQTTLGKASAQNEKDIDLSHVQKPIHTSIFGLNQVLSLLQTATDEVRNYITYECEIMYECRMCRTIFRSLANFILHKRSYCQERFHLFKTIGNNDVEEKSAVVENDEKESSSKGITTIINKLKEKQVINEYAQKLLNEDLSSKELEKNMNELYSSKHFTNDIMLERIGTNDAAVFQTVLETIPDRTVIKQDFMKSEVMEIHGILDSDEAVLGPDGKICSFETNKINENPIIPKNNFYCTECNQRFSTKKTLTYHIKYKHNHTRLVYICPECKDSFANAWCVFRHLLKVHRKTNSQVKRMRQQIHNSAIRISEGPLKKKDRNVVDVENTDDENQWLTNIEGDKDFQMCGGCGKRFERKAALQSHVQMCTKRMAVCNTIKENNAKRKEEESKDSKVKVNKVENVCPIRELKGASKRKPYLLRTYKSVEDAIMEKNVSIKCQTTCDVNANSEIIENNCDNNATIDISSNTSKINAPINLTVSTLTPSIEKIDTQKMLNIIGVSVSPNDPKLVQPAKDIDECSTNKEKLNSNTAIDFNVIYQNHSKHLQELEKDHKINIKDLENLDTMKKGAKNDPITLCRDALKFEENKTKHREEFINDVKQEIYHGEEDIEDVEEISNISYTIKANVSPQALKKRLSRPPKRKRSSSLEETKKSLKFVESVLCDDDMGLVDKARPYMNTSQLMCIPCQLRYPSMSKLFWHMSAHFSWFRFQCSRCSFISWSKTDCIRHANNVHCLRDSSSENVVFPIPSWRIMSMSNEFQELKGEFDLTGRHTDEIIPGSDEESILIKDEPEKTDEKIEYPDLFSDTENIEELCEKPFPLPIVTTQFALKQDSIDIVDECKDSFLMEVPSVMVETPYDIISIVDSEEFDERFRSNSPVILDRDEDIEKDYFIPVPKNEVTEEPDPSVVNVFNEIETDVDVKLDDDRFIIIDMDKMEAEGNPNMQEKEIIHNEGKCSNIHAVENFLKVPDPPVNSRPTRNRTRSIKTSQNDFFYDLNKVIKLNELGNNQKQRKSSSTNMQKIPEESIPANSKPMRVYLKKK